MQVKRGIVLPTAGFESINPKIPGPEKIRIALTPLPWPENEPRRCIVTNFGKNILEPVAKLDVFYGILTTQCVYFRVRRE